jgi:hypothetical protein
MNLFSLLTGKDYITLVKGYLDKVLVHEEKKYNVGPGDIVIMITKSMDRKIQIKTYSMVEGRVVRIIPDKEVQEILIQ